MHGVLRFTLIMGALSSLFDLATFGLLLKVFHADAAQFRTGWFAESIATQILVIFVIRTYGPAWKGRAHPVLVASSLGGLALALALIATPLGAGFGFVAIPGALAAALAAIVVVYLASAEAVKKIAAPRPRRKRWR
jgi:Mg2+-importing ATPase